MELSKLENFLEEEGFLSRILKKQYGMKIWEKNIQ